MNKYNYVVAWLALAIIVACTNDQGAAGSPVELSFTFVDSEASRFSDEQKAQIRGIVTDSEAEVRALLPTLPAKIDITAVIIDRNIDIVGGVTGRADAPGSVQFDFSSVFPGGVSAAAESALRGAVFHEFHHLDRGWTIEQNEFGPGIDIAAVNEGLASVFSEQYSGVYFPEANDYPPEAGEWLAEILALPQDANYGTWMFQHPDGRIAIGYRVGRYIIHQATASAGMDVLALGELSPDEILALVPPSAGGPSTNAGSL